MNEYVFNTIYIYICLSILTLSFLKFCILKSLSFILENYVFYIILKFQNLGRLMVSFSVFLIFMLSFVFMLERFFTGYKSLGWDLFSFSNLNMSFWYPIMVSLIITEKYFKGNISFWCYFLKCSIIIMCQGVSNMQLEKKIMTGPKYKGLDWC